MKMTGVVRYGNAGAMSNVWGICDGTISHDTSRTIGAAMRSEIKMKRACDARDRRFTDAPLSILAVVSSGMC
jgi:hypothetical protein